MKTVCETLGVARSNIAARAAGSPSRAKGRPPLPDRELVEDIKAIIADMPTYGYRRVHAILRRNARKDTVKQIRYPECLKTFNFRWGRGWKRDSQPTVKRLGTA